VLEVEQKGIEEEKGEKGEAEDEGEDDGKE
jgi:hypothetical protein